MSSKKENMIGVRFSNEERMHLEKVAEAHCMSLSQYIRYKILEADARDFGENNRSEAQSSPKHWPLLSTIIIHGYLCIKRLAENQLSEEELNEVNSETKERFKKLGL